MDGWMDHQGVTLSCRVVGSKTGLEELETLDPEFKQYHLAVIDALEEEEKLEWQQAILDDHDDLSHLERSVQRVNVVIKPMAPGLDIHVDHFLLEQCEEQPHGVIQYITQHHNHGQCSRPA